VWECYGKDTIETKIKQFYSPGGVNLDVRVKLKMELHDKNYMKYNLSVDDERLTVNETYEPLRQFGAYMFDHNLKHGRLVNP